MHRVRIGITGLAVVFLLVLLTAALIGSIRRNAPVHSATATATPAADPPKEPLAELGVAPGSAPAEATSGRNGTAAASPRPAHQQHH